MNAAVVCEKLSIVRGKTRAVDGLSLSLPAGAVIGLLGPSGAGKTSLLRALVGVQTGVSGTVSVLGLPAGSRALSTRVAYDTQSSSVFDDLTVEQNLDYLRHIMGLPRAAITRTLERVGLGEYARRYVRSLSGGQRNRVSLALALLGEPELLILDEPTVGLDPVLRGELWALFRELARAGTTVLVSSHVMDEAERCDRLLFMRNGHLIAQGTLDEILRDTHTRTAEQAFLALAQAEAPA